MLGHKRQALERCVKVGTRREPADGREILARESLHSCKRV